MNDATYELVCKHASRETHGMTAAPLTLVVDDKLVPDFTVLTKFEVRMCVTDYYDFRRRLHERDRQDFLTT